MSNAKDTARYAGFWVRLVAFIIDGIIVGIVSFPVGAALSFSTPWLRAGGYMVALIPILGGVASVFGFLYFTIFWAWRGQTLGKMAMRIRIVRTNGEPLSFGRAALRYLGYFVQFFFIVLIGSQIAMVEYISLIIPLVMFALAMAVVAFHKQKRGLHDIIASSCVVVKARGSDMA
jgi:uncharacterized RDD family membrane protein YckC